MEVIGSQYENSLTEAFFIEKIFNILPRQLATIENQEWSRNMW